MAQTAAAVQAELGTNPNNAQIVHSMNEGSTNQVWYVVGNQDAVGRCRWVTSTAADSAATQAASILTGLRA